MAHEEVEIVLVEDNPADLELTLRALKKRNVANTVRVARDGEEALDLLFCRGPFAGKDVGLPKVVLLDLKLPKVDGLEVLEALRKDPRTALVPVVILATCGCCVLCSSSTARGPIPSHLFVGNHTLRSQGTEVLLSDRPTVLNLPDLLQ